MDLDDLIRELEDSVDYIDTELPNTVRKIGDIAQKEIRSYTPVKTGKLKASIKNSVTGLTAEVGSSLDYVDDVEHGHNQEARYVPAIDAKIKAQFVKGSHMFEKGMLSAEPKVDAKVEEFFDNIPLLK